MAIRMRISLSVKCSQTVDGTLCNNYSICLLLLSAYPQENRYFGNLASLTVQTCLIEVCLILELVFSPDLFCCSNADTG